MSRNPQILYMSEGVFADVKATVGNAPAETGGMLGMRSGVISDYYFDNTADVSFRQYSPDADACSALLNGEWYPNGIRFCGFVHSHCTDPLPSESDRQYMQRLYAALSRADAPQLYLLIAHAPQSQYFSLHAYRALCDDESGFRLEPVVLEILE